MSRELDHRQILQRVAVEAHGDVAELLEASLDEISLLVASFRVGVGGAVLVVASRNVRSITA